MRRPLLLAPLAPRRAPPRTAAFAASSSGAIGCHRVPSEAIRSHRKPSEAIESYRKPLGSHLKSLAHRRLRRLREHLGVLRQRLPRPAGRRGGDDVAEMTWRRS